MTAKHGLTEFFAGREVETLDKLHDLSMSREEHLACQGRLGKIVATALAGWLSAETKRGTDPDCMLCAAHSGAMTVLFTTLVNVVPAGEWALIAADMREHIFDLYDETLARVRSEEITRAAAADHAMEPAKP